jgi:pantetheine-phosphate adenylyltransferase
LDESIDTIYLTPRVENSYVSSSLVKEVAAYGGNVSQHLPPVVLDALKAKLQTSA